MQLSTCNNRRRLLVTSACKPLLYTQWMNFTYWLVSSSQREFVCNLWIMYMFLSVFLFNARAHIQSGPTGDALDENWFPWRWMTFRRDQRITETLRAQIESSGETHDLSHLRLSRDTVRQHRLCLFLLLCLFRSLSLSAAVHYWLPVAPMIQLINPAHLFSCVFVFIQWHN